MSNFAAMKYHVIAILCVLMWGTTFVSTKILLNNGLPPNSIFFYRFILAYAVILFLAPKRLWADNIKDEFLLFCLGLTGGSVYFLVENTALEYTLVSNVALLVCTTPLLTVILSHWFVKGERLRRTVLYGSLLALIGVACVVYNGNFILKTNPTGDFLSLSASLLWAIYTIVLKRLDSRYPVMFLTRKIFFYGLLTVLPAFYFSPLVTDTAILFRPAVTGNLLFLGLFASMLCYALWNNTIKRLGPIRSSNYLYFNPIVSLITSAVVIHEKITPVALIGAAFVLGGVYWAGRKSNKPEGLFNFHHKSTARRHVDY
ncbi:MAG: DMT family transporter [Dysgonamonadaceae bacterium]|jgi:drug/metabolite transporter (DMT)-like permease|nr:DMT family transporter [Dysgonamonadaceae bacterium]